MSIEDRMTKDERRKHQRKMQVRYLPANRRDECGCCQPPKKKRQRSEAARASNGCDRRICEIPLRGSHTIVCAHSETPL